MRLYVKYKIIWRKIGPKCDQIVWPWMSNYFTASRFPKRANLMNLASKTAK